MALDELVDACLNPPRRERERTLPLILLRGTPGSSRDAVVETLESAFVARRPHAFCAVDDLPAGARPYEVADLVASRLAREVDGFGRLQFPRLLLGLLALRTNPRGPRVDPRRLQDLIDETLTKRNRMKVARWSAATEKVVERWLRLAQPDDDVRALVAAGVSALLSGAEAIAMLSKPGLEFYREGYQPRGRIEFANGQDGLLAMAEAHSHEPSRAGIDRALCRALLADIREEFDHAHPFRRSPLNGLVLIERADADPWAAFLRVLAEVRDAWAPILFVAGTATVGTVEPPGLLSRRAGRAVYDDWRSPSARGARAWGPWYPVEVDRSGHDDAEARDDDFVGRLTRGHTGARTIVQGALDAEEERTGERSDPRAAMALAAPGQGHHRTVADQLRDLVLRNTGAGEHEVLMYAAAARDLGQASVDAIEKAYQPGDPSPLDRFRRHDLWTVGPEVTDAARTPALHPLARRLLLHDLARAQASGDRLEHPDPWDAVHWSLSSSLPKDEAGSLHHALAAGDVHRVVTVLGRKAAHLPADEWCELFEGVVSAPVRAPAEHTSATEHAIALAAGPAVEGPVGRFLVTAAQVHADPLGDPHHELCGSIAMDLDRLRPSMSSRRAHLAEHALRYYTCYAHHHPSGGTSGPPAWRKS